MTRYAYDGLGRTVVITDALGNVTRYAYDGLGNRVAVSDPLTHTTVYTYDSLNRLIATANAEGDVTRYAYDALGKRTVMTDAEGRVTRYAYDAAGRLAAVVENYSGRGQTDERDVRTTYGYDALGNRTHVTNALGHTSVYTYDALGHLVAEADPLGHTSVYTHDLLGQRSFLRDADGTVVSYTYDAAGRVTAIHYPTSSVKYVYDRVGNRTTMTDSLGTTTYTYDALYRLQAVKDPFGAVVRYTYDGAGNRRSLIYPDGQTVTYTYDALDRLTTVEDWDGGLTRYGYDGAGRLVTTTLPNGVQSRYGYDDANRLTLIEHRDAGGALLARYVYQLDGVGNRTSVTETLLTPGEGRRPLAPSGHTVPVSFGRTGGSPENSGWAERADLSGSLAAARVGDDEIITDDVAWYADTVTVGNLLVTNSAVLTLAGTSGTRLTANDLYIASGARLVVSGAATITATNVTVEAGAFLSADGLGYGASDGPGAGADGVESLRQASGGGHGGWGGVGSDGYDAWDQPYDIYLPLVVKDSGRAGHRAKAAGHAGGRPYDDASRPRMMGSGGGSAGSAPGGAGGGALRLVVKDTLTLNGSLSANGLSGASDDFHAGGGGAGGSLWVEASAFSGNGVVRANGGDGGETSADNAYGQGGGGAGGRVAIYAPSGVFTATGGTISVHGGRGHQDGETGSIYISETTGSPVTVAADFTAMPLSGNAPLMVTFTNLSASSGETYGTYQWSFGDGSTLLTTGGFTSALENPTHAYTQTGNFTVILTATVGNEDDVEIKSGYISVTAESPVTVTADFAATPTSGDAPLTVTFTNLSTSSDGVESYQWDFGDGSTLLTTGGETSVLENPTHAFTQTGSFTVILTATAGSESDVEIKTDYITVNAPVRLELVTRTITYTYDGLYRLTTADYSSGEEFEYTYDAVGNQTAMTDASGLHIYAYDAANRLTRGDGVTYTWDNRGNLISNGDFTYTYNAAGRMVEARSITATLIYTYNADGLRLAQSTNGAMITLTWDLGARLPSVLATSDGASELYGLALIGERRGDEWHYLLPDALGSARQVSDGTGEVLLAQGYRPFGAEMWRAGNSASARGFTGEWWDRDPASNPRVNRS